MRNGLYSEVIFVFDTGSLGYHFDSRVNAKLYIFKVICTLIYQVLNLVEN